MDMLHFAPKHFMRRIGKNKKNIPIGTIAIGEMEREGVTMERKQFQFNDRLKPPEFVFSYSTMFTDLLCCRISLF